MLSNFFKVTAGKWWHLPGDGKKGRGYPKVDSEKNRFVSVVPFILSKSDHRL